MTSFSIFTDLFLIESDNKHKYFISIFYFLINFLSGQKKAWTTDGAHPVNRTMLLFLIIMAK